jgi:hypothetical protein
MKIVKDKMQWKEITTKTINIKARWKEFQEDMSVKSWIETNKRIKMYKGWRKSCCCCKTPWDNISGEIVFVQTDKGNKIICEKCWEDLQ